MTNNLYVESGLLETVKKDACVSDKEGDLLRKQTTEYLSDVMEEELMAKIQDYLGDGDAKLVVGADLATNIEFGNKAGAFCSVSVLCDNSLDSVQKVHDLVQPWVKHQVQKDLAEMEEVRTRILSGGAPLEKIVAPSKAAPKRSVKGKPDFQR